jgi:hypothetical protein
MMWGMLPTAATLFERLPRFLRRHRLMTAWMDITGEDPVQLVRIRESSFGYADLSDGFMRLLVIDYPPFQDFFRVADALLHEGGVLFDVGANQGLLSAGVAGRYGAGVSFHLFEPNAVLIDMIKRTLSRYPEIAFKLNQVAVSNHEGVEIL